MKKWFFLHPILFSFLPTIVLYKQNIREAWPIIMVEPLLATSLLLIISWLICWFLLKNKYSASILCTIWLILFFAYGHVFLLFANIGLFKLLPFGPHLSLLAIFVAVLLTSVIFLKKLRSSFLTATGFFNFVALAMVSVNLFTILPFEWRRYQADQKLQAYLGQEQKKLAVGSDTEKPDIYYLVFDRYPNQTIAKNYFNLDNSFFLENLKSKSFFVAERATANYPASFESLSSSLNMSHLQFLSELLGPNYSDQAVIYKNLLQTNEVTKFLTGIGYDYYHLGSSWEPTKQSNLATENHNLFLGFNEFNSYIFENTLANVVLGKLFENGQVFTGLKVLQIQLENEIYKKYTILNLAEKPGPKFIFAHFLLPHPPYLLSEDCLPLKFEVVRTRSDEVGYIDQVKCANKMITEITDKILAQKDRPVAIVLQSDEGPYLPANYFKNEYQFVESENNDAYKIHGRVFSAIYLSDKDIATDSANYQEANFTPDQTPVNTFRKIFNYYFNLGLEMLPDTTYIFRDNHKPYLFEEVSDLVKVDITEVEANEKNLSQ